MVALNLRNFDICAEVEAGVGFIFPVKQCISLGICVALGGANETEKLDYSIKINLFGVNNSNLKGYLYWIKHIE